MTDEIGSTKNHEESGPQPTFTGSGSRPSPATFGYVPRASFDGRFSITISWALGAVVVTVDGCIGAPHARHLEEILKDVIQHHEGQGVVVDLRDASRVHPEGVRPARSKDALLPGRPTARAR